MVFMLTLFTLLLQSESSIKIPLRKLTSRQLVSKFSMPSSNYYYEYQDILYVLTMQAYYLIGNISIRTPTHGRTYVISLIRKVLNGISDKKKIIINRIVDNSFILNDDNFFNFS